MTGLIAVQHLKPFELALGRRGEDHVVPGAGDANIKEPGLFLAGAQGCLLAERRGQGGFIEADVLALARIRPGPMADPAAGQGVAPIQRAFGLGDRLEQPGFRFAVETGQDDQRPLEALGAVIGHHLHGVRLQTLWPARFIGGQRQNQA